MNPRMQNSVVPLWTLDFYIFFYALSWVTVPASPFMSPKYDGLFPKGSTEVATPRRRLPPLNTVAAFEASARLLSFTRAAEELNLSQGAVSRQIQVLEERLGVPLFSRRHKEIQLTKAGTIFQSAIAESLNSIRRAASMIEMLDVQTVTIAASVGMSSFWLMPAILAFSDLYPDINIRVHASDHLIDTTHEFVDLRIKYGDARISGMTSVKLFDEEVFPICSAKYGEMHKISCPEDLTRQTLIEYDDGLSAFGSWENWLKLAKVEYSVLRPSMNLSNYDLVYRAICAGKGVGLTWSYVIAEEMRDTLLVRPLDITVKTGLAEHIVFSEDAPLSPSAAIVLEWLIEHARASVWTIRKSAG